MFSELKTTQFPQCNWRLDVESALRDRVTKTTVDIRYSGDFSDKKKKIYFNHAGSFQAKDQAFQMNHEAQFTYKAFVSTVLKHHYIVSLLNLLRFKSIHGFKL